MSDGIKKASTMASRVREARKAAKLTQAKLAQAIGKDSMTISRIERGETTDPDTSTIEGIAKVTGKSVEWLRGTAEPTEVTYEILDDESAPAPEERIERVIEAMGLETEIADKLRRTKWTGGTPSEATLRSFALDLILEKRDREFGRDRPGPEAEKPRSDRGGMKLGAGKGKMKR